MLWRIIDPATVMTVWLLIVPGGRHQDFTGTVFADKGECYAVADRLNSEDASAKADCFSTPFFPWQDDGPPQADPR